MTNSFVSSGARLVATFVSALLSTFGFALGQSAAAGSQRTVRVLDLHGTPFERGFQHGQQLKAEIAALLPHFERDLLERGMGTVDEFVEWFLGATKYDEAIRRHVPGLLDEVRGLAQGAGQDFDTMLVYQLVDEYWVQSMLRERGDKCTTVGVARDGGQPTIVAQNLDVPHWMHRYPTVLRIRHSDSELASLVVTIPGLIGAMGLNSNRVGIGVNTIMQIQSCRDGLPVAFVVRGVLEQPNAEAARAFLQRVRHASGQAYTIGGPDDVTCHECSANAIVRFVPERGPDRVWHTNHPVASKDYSELYRGWVAQSGGDPDNFDFGCTRFPAVERVLSRDGVCGPDAIEAALSARGSGVCNPSTYTCIVMQLGEAPTLRMSAGAPDQAEFTTVRLQD
ncbi:MAG: C45 family peptidase [bacterium]|nr:C45 family peptidase [bacterium]